jgi:hypothetical protein
MRDVILGLEMRLLSPETRHSPDELGELLTDDFVEFGASGNTHSKDDVIQALRKEAVPEFKIEDFTLKNLSPELALATYVLEKVDASDGTSSRSLRSSIWTLQDKRWRLMFHQGTML